MDYIKRQNKLIKLLDSKSLDGLLIKKKQNISYLVSARGEDAILFISCKKNFLITSSMYEEEYAKALENCELKLAIDSGLMGCIKECCVETRSKCIGFESAHFSYSEYVDLKKKLKNITLIPVRDTVESLRMLKDNDEVRCIKRACKYGCDAMKYGLKNIHPSFSEWAIKTKIEAYIAKKGIRQADFDIIVASGKNASQPHGSASRKKLKRGEMVLIDLGAMNYGYNSDLTRTVFLGKIDRKYSHIYNIVLSAQRKAIEIVKPGIRTGFLDAISRQYISEKGLGKYFIHGIGHGIGLEVHEKPTIRAGSRLPLEANMAITIEPALYIPGWGGIRIEDVVLVTKNGCEVLTDSVGKYKA